MEQKLKCDVYIGKNLRRLREKFGLSQEKLCAELQCRNCDIGRSTYAKYENGELNIRISVLMELKKIYNCSYGCLLTHFPYRVCGRGPAYATMLPLRDRKSVV